MKPEDSEAATASSKKKKKKNKKKKNKDAEGEEAEEGDQNEDKRKEEPNKASNEERKEEDGEEEDDEETKDGEGAKKKKKRKRNKKKGTQYAPREQDNSHIRILGSWKAGEFKQTDPPTIPITTQFPDGKYPIGEIVEYMDSNNKRITGEEYREKERLFTMDYEALRRSAEAHR